MRLWTIQPLAVDEIIRKNGYYVCDISKSPYSLACESFKKAYDWMNEQMAKRIGPMPEDVTYPIWAWHSWDFKHVKPDLRRTEFRVIEDSSFNYLTVAPAFILEVIIGINKVPIPMKQIHEGMIIHQIAASYFHDFVSKTIFQFIKKRILLDAVVRVSIDAFQIVSMAKLFHLKVDISTLVEAEIKAFLVALEINIAVVAFHGDGKFLARSYNSDLLNIGFHQDCKNFCHHLAFLTRFYIFTTQTQPPPRTHNFP